MRRLLSIFFCGLGLVLTGPLAAAPPAAKAVGAVDDGDPRVEVELLLDRESASPGEAVRAGVHFTIDPDWHVYWKNSGDSGLSTELEIDGLDAVGPQSWPSPHVFVDPSGEVATFGYSDEVLFYREGRIPEDASGAVEVLATIDYLACKIDCIPGRHELRRTLKVGPSSPADFPDELASALPSTPNEVGLTTEFAMAKSAVGPSEEFEATLSLACEGSECPTSRVVEQPAKRYTFIPSSTAPIAWKTAALERLDEATVLRVEGRTNARIDDTGACRLDGVVWLDSTPPRAVKISHEVACTTESVAAVKAPSSSVAIATARESAPSGNGQRIDIFTALLLALIGGMLLNLMPCVFPVLAVKVFSFVRLAHENQASILRHSAAYTAGIIASMMALAAVVIGLKTAGTQVGWGFQFQEPLFVAVLSAALILFALNLFGVFEVSVGTGGLESVREAEHSLRRSFGEGILAVVLATPCSAPFLGTAVGFAFSEDSATIVAIFFALGLGLALPFAILTAVPGWAKLLPKPGAWMETFKQLLGFALLGTVVWLAWVLGQSAGNDAVTGLLAWLIAIALAGWGWGKVQWGPTPRKIGVALIGLALIGGVGFVALDFDAPSAPRYEPADEEGDSRTISEAFGEGPADWEAFEEPKVQRYLDAGEIVFVDFTADWCITCKVNERGVLSSSSTRTLFESHGVRPLVADWTRRDDRIRAILARHGKAGVPLYLVWHPSAPDNPQVLPELLTESILRDAIESKAP